MQTRFKKGAKIFDIVITAVAGMVSVGVMLYGIAHFGLAEAWPELVLNMFYIACLVMIWMYFFNSPHITTQQFNYWCSISVGMTVLLRDILFAPPLAYYGLHLACLTLSVLLLCALTFFYARKNWKSYTKRNLWLICIIDMIILQPGHLPGTHQRVHQLHAHGDLDPSHHHLRPRGVLRDGSRNGQKIAKITTHIINQL